MTDEFDIHRSEGEGMLQGDLENLHRIYSFLDQVKIRFVQNQSFKHLEDAARDLIEKMSEEERERYKGLAETLPIIMESFQGPKAFEKWMQIERDRILEFDKHESEGVG